MHGQLENCKCFVCGQDACKQLDYDDMTVFYICPICGRFEIHHDLSSDKINFACITFIKGTSSNKYSDTCDESK